MFCEREILQVLIIIQQNDKSTQVWFCLMTQLTSESVLGIKPGDSGVVIWYQVDEFTHTWSAEQFVAHSHIYPRFTGKVSLLTHFPMELEC